MKCCIEAHEANPPKATKVVLDSDGKPYLYLCDCCAEAFLEGQEVFDLIIEDIDDEDTDKPPQGN